MGYSVEVVGRRKLLTCIAAALISGAAVAAPLQAASFRLEQATDRVVVNLDGRPIATYVYRDKVVRRPYFANLHAPDGTPVTRNWPPKAGEDPTDHADMHPGLWLAFGDISGVDFWRNKGSVEHERFVEPPTARQAVANFTVLNRYVDPSSQQVLCHEEALYSFRSSSAGVLLIWQSKFSSPREFYFGDQEEMGLGLRIATPLTVTHGGQILDTQGRRDEREIWGKKALWCDYSKQIGNKHVGVTLLTDPANFAGCWMHVRDYGLLVANPFGRNAFTKEPPSKVSVGKSETLRLRFGILLHATRAKDTDIRAAYKDFQRDLASMDWDKSGWIEDCAQ